MASRTASCRPIADRKPFAAPVAGRRAARDGGFTYIGLLILIAIIAVAATATIQLGSVTQRRSAEQELLFLGDQFIAALTSYARATPTGQQRAPKTLEQLLRDPRVPGVRRHLRRVPVDPLTGKAEWGLVRSADGLIVGVHSLSDAAPIKRGNFEPAMAQFAAAKSYGDWVFKLTQPVVEVKKPADGKADDKK